MKKVLLLVLAACLTSGCAAKKPPKPPKPPVPVDFPVTLKWSYDFTNYFQCSATITKGCVSGFSWGYMAGTSQVPLHTVTTAACTGATQPQSCSDLVNTQLPVGAVTFYVVANTIDVDGVVGTSSPGLSTPDTIVAGAPTGVTEVHQ